MQNKQNRWQLSRKVYSCWTNINMCLVNNISTVRNSVDQSESKAQPCTSTPEKSVVYNVSWAEFKLQIASIGTSHLYTTHLGMLLLRNKKLHQNCGYHETQESTERSQRCRQHPAAMLPYLPALLGAHLEKENKHPLWTAQMPPIEFTLYSYSPLFFN